MNPRPIGDLKWRTREAPRIAEPLAKGVMQGRTESFPSTNTGETMAREQDVVIVTIITPRLELMLRLSCLFLLHAGL